jgi:hypothetical protein
MTDDITKCDICGLGYATSYAPDVKLHNRMHKQWLEVAQLWGIDPIHTRSSYEGDKHKYRHIFSENSGYSLSEQVDAAIAYLHAQWKDRGLWASVRYNSYSSFEQEYPDIPSWIKANYKNFSHEFSISVQSAICKRYGIAES